MLHNKFDIVLSSEVTQPATFFAMISRLRSRAQKLVVWQEMAAHQSVVKKIPSRVLHATYVAHALSHAVDCFVPRSRSSAHFLRNYVPANKIAAPIIHGGDPTIFYPADTPPSFDWWFVYPARLVPNKNVERAIDTIAVLRKLGFPARLTVVGDGPLRENLQARISAFGLENAVILQTKRLDAAAMRALYISCSAMLVTTDRDLALLSVVEAVACACPVVVGTGADVAEDVEAADVGIAVRDHSTQGFVDALIRLGTDVSLRMRMRKRALEQHARFTDAAGEFVALFERENYLGPRP
jgi:glycosyltransferase involved in cell wall biosynthesis